MSGVFKVAKFKLKLSNRKKRILRITLKKYTNSLADALQFLYEKRDDLEFAALDVKTSKSGKEIYKTNTNKIHLLVNEYLNSSQYKNYRFKERISEEISNNLSSYFALRLKNENPSYPIKVKVEDAKNRDIYLNKYYDQLINCGIGEDGIDENAHIKETELLGEINRLTKQDYQPFNFLRARDFKIIEQRFPGKPPRRIALLDILDSESTKKYLNKSQKSTPNFKGFEISTGASFEMKSTKILPVILEWSLFHDLNFFRIGEPKTAKLVYEKTENEFYLHVTFEFLTHIDKNGKLHYLKRVFDEEATRVAEKNLPSGKKLKVYVCYDAITKEFVEVTSINKTTHTKKRITDTYLGVDLGRKMLAAYAVVKDGKILYKNYAESSELSKTLYSIYENIGELQKAGKQNRKKLRSLYKSVSNITKNNVHQTVNKIIWAREYYNSQIILENLSGLKRIPKKKVQQYSRIANLITYKSQLKGFSLNYFTPPKAYFEVYPSQTSKLCSRCGFTHIQNRQIEISQDKFKCIACGYEENADINAAINIARLGEFIYKYKDVYSSFDEYLRNLCNCYNSNFDTYREGMRKRYIIKKINSIIGNQIKVQKKNNIIKLK
ncbi:putative transposase DNA-binding domain protein [bacterium BMS3Abin04]|nr:putative transposase DNA-binding domain protein [bacterium BMS3Abin04]